MASRAKTTLCGVGLGAVPPLVSLGAMVAQGGFGGGHGALDPLIVLGACPLALFFNLVGGATNSDFLNFVFLPWVANAMVIWLLVGLWFKARPMTHRR